MCTLLYCNNNTRGERHSKISGWIDFSRNITKSLTLILNFFMKSALYSGLLDKLDLYVFFDNYFVPFALYFRKIIKKSKEYQRFWDPGSVFSIHVETKNFKFLNFLVGEEGREGEGKVGEGKGRGEKEWEKGWGVSIWAPHFKMCCYGPGLSSSVQ